MERISPLSEDVKKELGMPLELVNGLWDDDLRWFPVDLIAIDVDSPNSVVVVENPSNLFAEEGVTTFVNSREPLENDPISDIKICRGKSRKS